MALTVFDKTQTPAVLPLSGGTMTGSIAFSPTTNGITGTTTNDNAAAGNIGEVISNSVLRSVALSLANSTAKTITSISLTPGDWNVYGMVGYTTGTGTSITTISASLNTVTNAFPSGDKFGVADSTGVIVAIQQTAAQVPANGADNTVLTPSVRVSLSAPTTYFLIAFAQFTVSTLISYGSIVARRVR